MVVNNQTDVGTKEKQVIEKQHSITSTVWSADTYVTLSDDFDNGIDDIGASSTGRHQLYIQLNVHHRSHT